MTTGEQNYMEPVRKSRRVTVVEYPWWWHTLALVGFVELIQSAIRLFDLLF